MARSTASIADKQARFYYLVVMLRIRTDCLTLAALLMVPFGCQRADAAIEEPSAAGGTAQTLPFKHQVKLKLLDHGTAKGALDEATTDFAIYEVQANALGTIRLRVRDPLSEQDTDEWRGDSGKVQSPGYVQSSLKLREDNWTTPVRPAVHVTHHRGARQHSETAARVVGEAAGSAVSEALRDYDQRELIEVRCSWSRGSDVLQGQEVHYRTEPPIKSTRENWTWGLQPSAYDLERGGDYCQLFNYRWGGSAEDVARVKVPLDASDQQCLVVDIDYQ